MAVKRQLVINAQDSSQNSITTTINNINPSDTITNVQLKTAAMELNSLTSNTIVSIEVVNTENITSAE